ncbi:hypothetical protein SK128_020858, partial [Halocaridina rubra]
LKFMRRKEALRTLPMCVWFNISAASFLPFRRFIKAFPFLGKFDKVRGSTRCKRFASWLCAMLTFTRCANE